MSSRTTPLLVYERSSRNSKIRTTQALLEFVCNLNSLKSEIDPLNSVCTITSVKQCFELLCLARRVLAKVQLQIVYWARKCLKNLLPS
jgi:hypothetical protein